MITPAAIATTILFLGSKRPVGNATAFAAAFAFVYTVNAAVILYLSTGVSETVVDDHTKSLITAIIGIVLLDFAVAGVIRSRGRRASRVAPRVRTPGWMTAVDTAGPRVAFGLGLALAILNPNIPILIAGLTTTAAAGVSTGDQVLAATFLIAFSQIGLAGPIIWFVSHRSSAERGLSAVKGWLERREEAVNSAMLIVFGALFTISGINGL